MWERFRRIGFKTHASSPERIKRELSVDELRSVEEFRNQIEREIKKLGNFPKMDMVINDLGIVEPRWGFKVGLPGDQRMLLLTWHGLYEADCVLEPLIPIFNTLAPAQVNRYVDYEKSIKTALQILKNRV